MQPPPLEDCKGDITSYRLQYREQGDNGIWKTCNIPTTTNQPTTYTIEDLQPATKYDIQVAAKNSSGCGPFSPGNKCSTDQGKVTLYLYTSGKWLWMDADISQLQGDPMLLQDSQLPLLLIPLGLRLRSDNVNICIPLQAIMHF